MCGSHHSAWVATSVNLDRDANISIKVICLRYMASVSFGKDSLAMLLKLIETEKPLDEVIFYNTGMEFECVYHIRDRVIELLKQHNITYTELHPDEPFCILCLNARSSIETRTAIIMVFLGVAANADGIRTTNYKLSIDINEFDKR